MFLLSDESEIMTHDERVLIRRRDAVLGDNTVVVDGIRLHRGHSAEFALNCNIQPVSGEELMKMPEGDRFDEQYYCYVSDKEQPTQADDLLYRPADNLWYVCTACENWGSYSKLTIRQQDIGDLDEDGANPLQRFDRQLFVSASKIR